MEKIKFINKKGAIVRFIKEAPFTNLLYWKYTEFLVGKNHRKKSVNVVFEDVFKNAQWAKSQKESISGPGSILKVTQNLINELPIFFKKHEINSILDCPCGDFNWMKEIDLSKVNYIGGDIIQELVNQNNLSYQTNRINFIHIDLIKDILPEVDLIFVRDCLVHFSFEMIVSFFENLSLSKIKFVMLTNFPLTKNNFDITTGNWRPLNFQLAPFNFSEPVDVIFEKCIESYGQYPDKSLAMYKVDDVKKYLASI